MSQLLVLDFVQFFFWILAACMDDSTDFSDFCLGFFVCVFIFGALTKSTLLLLGSLQDHV